MKCIRREDIYHPDNSPEMNKRKKGKSDVYLKNDFLPPELAYQQQDYDHSNKKLENILKHLKPSSPREKRSVLLDIENEMDIEPEQERSLWQKFIGLFECAGSNRQKADMEYESRSTYYRKKKEKARRKAR